MSVTLKFTAKINGALVDVTSCDLDDQNEDFGVRRQDNLDVVVASGTAIPRISLGTYQYEFAEPEPDLTYEYTVKIVYSSTTYYFNRYVSAEGITALISIPTTDHYTSQAEVLRVFGEYAVDLSLDDYDGENKGYFWNQFLYDTDETMKMYLMQHYDPDDLYEVEWVRRRATWLVCNLISQRRGNNPLFHSKTERIYDELNMIRDGRMRIPGATVRHWQGPMWRNYSMQNRYYRHPVRIDRTKSNRQSYSGQDDSLSPYFYIYG
jgi:hypothetical protein